MKALYIVAVFLFSLRDVHAQKYILSMHYTRRNITMNFVDSNANPVLPAFKYKFKKENGKKYFIIDNTQVYWEVDKEAVYNGSLDSFCSKNVDYTWIPKSPMRIFSLAVIIDAKGNIIYQGLWNGLDEGFNELDFFRVSRLLKGTFKPAMVNGHSAATINTYWLNERGEEIGKR